MSPVAMVVSVLINAALAVACFWLIGLCLRYGRDARTFKEVEKLKGLRDVKNYVAVATHEGTLTEHARVVLPASSWAEADGTFVNAKGMAQESEKVIAPQGSSRPAWRWLSDLSRELGHAPAWRKVAELRAAFLPESAALTPAAGVGAGVGS